ncbi:MAG: nuclear transport factor 2 family protein [candidate division Zixibacteria bacterium]|nr:nuclear transport factor 2 family protein [candidate division Zixibacteria bacterium]NIR66566.1 nuclear transport factor 2 family protein [candidate division Zixibacteria bacterium]NIS48131.1 nuclear transport factor 2 family protein [candidate division Zixibacteria bacterium]NIT54601.1 nuclear transport factor 2 family protein [candidate division Zixibacteria bacterium]NIU16253.1 nuclear transport factor 2 family protein [candidate division Zixibacteria bacterium]
MIRNLTMMLVLACGACLVLSCVAEDKDKPDVVNGTFPEAQAELQVVLKEIYDDAMAVNIEGLKAIHLNSPKFTKFGPRSFERQNVEQTNASEASFFSSISDLKVELKDVKIDVFDDVAVTTFYPTYSLKKDGEVVEGMSRQTLVFLRTSQGWRIIHEHGTTKK